MSVCAIPGLTLVSVLRYCANAGFRNARIAYVAMSTDRWVESHFTLRVIDRLNRHDFLE